MKKAFALVVLTVAPMMAFAQGTVILGNQTGLVRQWDSMIYPTLINVPKGGGCVELFAAPIGTPLVNPLISVEGNANYSSIAGFLAANPGWALPSNAAGAGTPGLIGLGAGVFADGTYTINNIGDGANAEYFLIGWAGAFATADAALAAANVWPLVGESAIYTTATSSLVGTPSAPLPVNLRGTFGGMTLFPIDSPEPSFFTLAGLGFAALLVLRRRKYILKSVAMRLQSPACLAGGLALLVNVASGLAQGTFQNLDFERARIAPTPAGQWGNFADPAQCFPGWTVGGSGTVVAHNDLSLGAPAVVLMGPSFPKAPGYTPLQGS
jgi:hypothetical protein